MNRLFAAGIFILFSTVMFAAEDFQPFGSWGNVQVTGDESTEYHADGFEFQLYRHNAEFVGYLHEYVSEPYDPPMGRLDNIRVNEKTGEISFETKMSLYIEGPTSIRNSKDLYRFKGKIDDKGIVGVMESLNPQTKAVESKKEVVLLGHKGGELHKGRKTYEEWRSSKENLMKERGPKW